MGNDYSACLNPAVKRSPALMDQHHERRQNGDTRGVPWVGINNYRRPVHMGKKLGLSQHFPRKLLDARVVDQNGAFIPMIQDIEKTEPMTPRTKSLLLLEGKALASYPFDPLPPLAENPAPVTYENAEAVDSEGNLIDPRRPLYPLQHHMQLRQTSARPLQVVNEDHPLEHP
ncbi:hypothetical protein AOQ84DRAFT_362785 [Glonium stellatum]|uniref:Uncharacterized protein n=1 Tax=Glonium stellatum TaxID=574774 RepID=A0A8E2F4V1_9PEZI|nr:hypothetical protein AOQ84DRAFT_362785 [Glonium stellatum]